MSEQRSGPVCERCGKAVVFDRIAGHWVHATTGRIDHQATPLSRVVVKTRRSGIS